MHNGLILSLISETSKTCCGNYSQDLSVPLFFWLLAASERGKSKR